MKRIRGAGKLVCVMLLALWPAPSHLMAQANVQGQWTTLPYTMPINPIHGAANASVFDPVSNSFTDLPTMAHGRWYPTVTTLGDGRILTFSGLNETGITNTAVEIFTSASNTWSPEYKAGWTPPLYPRLHLLPNGKVFYSGSTTKSRYFDPSTHTWGVIATTNYASTRTYGSSVLFPLTPANNYKPVVMIMG